MLCTASEAIAIKSAARSEAAVKFGEGYKADYAADCVGHGVDFFNHLPIGWNLHDNDGKIRYMVEAHIRENVTSPKGFIIPTFVLTWILSFVIKWAIEYVLKLWWNRKQPVV